MAASNLRAAISALARADCCEELQICLVVVKHVAVWARSVHQVEHIHCLCRCSQGPTGKCDLEVRPGLTAICHDKELRGLHHQLLDHELLICSDALAVAAAQRGCEAQELRGLVTPVVDVLDEEQLLRFRELCDHLFIVLQHHEHRCPGILAARRLQQLLLELRHELGRQVASVVWV